MEGMFPEVVFTVLGVPVRDTVISTWVMVCVTVLAVYLVGKRQPEVLQMLIAFITELSRTLSLTLRLFGNVISMELIFAVVFSLVPLIVPLLPAAFSLFTGALQAYIFTVLAAVYIDSAVASESM